VIRPQGQVKKKVFLAPWGVLIKKKGKKRRVGVPPGNPLGFEEPPAPGEKKKGYVCPREQKQGRKKTRRRKI